jgi:hypothetical protein
VAAGVATDAGGNTSAGLVDSALTTITGGRVLKISNTRIPSMVNVGSTHAFLVNYSNTGSQASLNTVIYITIPAYAKFDLASAAGWQLVSGRRYKLVVGTLDVGARGSAAVNLTFTKPPQLGYVASLTSTITDEQSKGKSISTVVSNFAIGKPATRARW